MNGITHNHEATPIDKVGCAEWNDEHKIVNMFGYELVEQKDLPAGTTTSTFSGLDGNVDEEYLLETDVNIVGSVGAESEILLRPNNHTAGDAAGNHYSQFEGELYTLAESSARWPNVRAYIVVATTVGSVATQCKSNIKIYPPTGKNRLGMGQMVAETTTYLTSLNTNFSWRNTSENITSLVIIISKQSFSGTIRLWRRIPING
jgi:hypothetical protein